MKSLYNIDLEEEKVEQITSNLSTSKFMKTIYNFEPDKKPSRHKVFTQ